MNKTTFPRAWLAALALLGATAAQAAAPTVTVTRNPDPFVASQPYTLSWTSANTSKLSYKCTGGDSGASGNLALNGSSTATAKTNWIGNPSICTWTLQGTDGSTVTWQEPPRVTVAAGTATAPTVTVTRTPDPFIAGQPYTLSWTSANTSKLSYKCTGGDSGASGNLALTGSSTATAKANWIGNPSICTWTLQGTGGSTITWQEPPRVTVAASSTPPASQAATYNVDISYVLAGQGGAGQPQSVTYPSSKTLTYQYDATGQITGINWNGRPLITSLTWNPLGQPTGWTWAFVNGAPNATRAYNTAGQLASNGIASYQYDDAGRVSWIVQNLYGPAGTTNGPATPITITTTVGYDAAGRVNSVTHAAIGNATGITDQPPANLPPIGAPTLPAGIKLQDIIGPLNANYSYDANGNRGQVLYNQYDGSGGVNSLVRDFTLNPANNHVEGVRDILTQTTGGPVNQTRTLQWDTAGYLKSDGKLNLEYDPRGQINKITNLDTGSISTYQSNALGQRVRKVVDGQVTDTVYGEELGMASYPLGHYIPGNNGSIAASTEYIYLPTANGPMPIAVQIGNALYAIDTDHLNTPRRLTDSNGNPAWQWVTTGFGEIEPTTAATGFTRARVNTGTPIAGVQAVTFNLRYPGQQYDAETGLYYNHHRYYDPYLTVGYTQADPIGLAGGWNRYGYVQGDPVNGIDPLGLAAVLITTYDYGIGSHSAIYIENGRKYLYDPGGTYTIQPNPWEPPYRPSGGVFVGDKEVDITSYIKYHLDSGSSVEVIPLGLTDDQERELIKQIQRVGDHGAGYCAKDTSEALGKVKKINETPYPGRLAAQFK